MTRALTFAIPLSPLAWTAIGLMAWYAPGVLLAIGGGTFLAAVYDVVVEE